MNNSSQPANKAAAFVIMIIFGVGGAWVVGNLIKAADDASQAPNKVKQASAEPKRSAVSIAELSVGELYAAFRANELGFDQKYVGKTVTISGQVDDVKDGLFDQGYIVKFIGEPYGHCELAPNQLDAAAKLSAGQTVKMQGVVEKGIVGFSLNDCILLK